MTTLYENMTAAARAEIRIKEFKYYCFLVMNIPNASQMLKRKVAFVVVHHLTVRSTVYSKKNSVALVRERTIQTERPPPVCEVSANFCG